MREGDRETERNRQIEKEREMVKVFFYVRTYLGLGVFIPGH